MLLVIVLMFGCSPVSVPADTYYVDAPNGNDLDTGTIEQPFKTLTKGFSVLQAGDTLILREGIYIDNGFSDNQYKRDYELYTVDLQGTKESPITIKTIFGEYVVIDDSYQIPSNIWSLYQGDIWVGDPGFVQQKFGQDYVTMGMRLVLQDDEPLLMVNSVQELTEGSRYYDEATGRLYVWLYDNKAPQDVLLDSWKGQHADARFRHCFGGRMEHVIFKGIEFKGFYSIFKPSLEEHIVNQTLDYLTFKRCDFIFGYRVFFSDTTDHTLITNPHQEWVINDCNFISIAAEIFQVQGDGHKFKDNTITDAHNSKWYGDYAGQGCINPKHMNDVKIKGNYIQSSGEYPKPGTGVVFEMDPEQADENGDCVYTGAKIKENVFDNFIAGNPIYLGKSGCRMSGVVIKENVFSDINDNAIIITCPQKGLKIKDNKSCNISKWDVKAEDSRGPITFESMENTIEIKDNIYGGRGVQPRVLDEL